MFWQLDPGCSSSILKMLQLKNRRNTHACDFFFLFKSNKLPSAHTHTHSPDDLSSRERDEIWRFLKNVKKNFRRLLSSDEPPRTGTLNLHQAAPFDVAGWRRGGTVIPQPATLLQLKPPAVSAASVQGAERGVSLNGLGGVCAAPVSPEAIFKRARTHTHTHTQAYIPHTLILPPPPPPPLSAPLSLSLSPPYLCCVARVCLSNRTMGQLGITRDIVAVAASLFCSVKNRHA